MFLCTIAPQIKVPMLMLNALDDPVVPEALTKYPREFAGMRL